MIVICLFSIIQAESSLSGIKRNAVFQGLELLVMKYWAIRESEACYDVNILDTLCALCTSCSTMANTSALRALIGIVVASDSWVVSNPRL